MKDLSALRQKKHTDAHRRTQTHTDAHRRVEGEEEEQYEASEETKYTKIPRRLVVSRRPFRAVSLFFFSLSLSNF